MAGNPLLLLLAVVALAAVPVGHAAPPPPEQIALQGDGHAVPACAACHGRLGEGNGPAGFPRLAGLPERYLAAQLEALANGTRRSAVMEPAAQALSARQRQQLARYYAGLPAAGDGAAVPGGTPDGQLALHGRRADEIPACVTCHGTGGSGVGSRFPPLAGQPAVYIAGQLQAWRQGTRNGDPLGLMKAVALRLTEQDIQAVSDWFAAQPVTATGAAR